MLICVGRQENSECFFLFFFLPQFPSRRFGSHHPGRDTRQLRAVHSGTHPLLPPLRVSHRARPQTRWGATPSDGVGDCSFPPGCTQATWTWRRKTVKKPLVWFVARCSPSVNLLFPVMSLCWHVSVQRWGRQDGRGSSERWWRRNTVKPKRYRRVFSCFLNDVVLRGHAFNSSFLSPLSPGSEQVQGSFGDQVLPSESCSVEQKSIAKQRAQIVIYINFSIGTSWLLTCKSKDFNRRKIKTIFHFRIQPVTTTFFLFFFFFGFVLKPRFGTVDQTDGLWGRGPPCCGAPPPQPVCKTEQNLDVKY